MAKLIYVSNVTLDGFIEDEHGGFAWTEPSDDAFAFITDLVRPVGTYLYGRRLYETMAVWETDPALAAQSEIRADFASVWQTADKIVYSATLDAVSTAKSRLERRFDPDSSHRSPANCAPRSSCSMSAGSTTGLCTSAIASRSPTEDARTDGWSRRERSKRSVSSATHWTRVFALP
jgi:hypothetical protein